MDHKLNSAPRPTKPKSRRAMKAGEGVALEILRDIVADKKKAGDRLPLESQMLTQYGVSRPSLREALRLLEFQGLIAIRPGPGSSTVVGGADPENLARTIVLFLHLSGATYDELLETWQMTEPLLARRAALNPDRSLVERTMAPFVADERTQCMLGHAMEIGANFHMQTGILANNRVLSLVCHAVSSIASNHVAAEVPSTAPVRLLHDHASIATAIVQGDADLAALLMSQHVRHIIDAFRKDWPEKIGERRLDVSMLL
jgi:GntR family transcriptional repressor for pyruvate dehydrogenase complex